MKTDIPNILFMITDQQHAKMMSCAGARWLHTPAMDELAQKGVRFERAYCTNPVCVTSRISMATGMMPNRLGAIDNKEGAALEKLPIEIVANSMGTVMKRAGCSREKHGSEGDHTGNYDAQGVR